MPVALKACRRPEGHLAGKNTVNANRVIDCRHSIAFGALGSLVTRPIPGGHLPFVSRWPEQDFVHVHVLRLADGPTTSGRMNRQEYDLSRLTNA
jgi:hypothetical protein